MLICLPILRVFICRILATCEGVIEPVFGFIQCNLRSGDRRFNTNSLGAACLVLAFASVSSFAIAAGVGKKPPPAAARETQASSYASPGIWTGIYAGVSAGYALGNFMPYMTAGLAFSDIENAGANPRAGLSYKV